MGETQHSRAKAVFREALDVPPGERSALLDRACGADVGLRHEVESLLSHHDPVSLFDTRADTPADLPGRPLAAGFSTSTSGWRPSHLFASPTRRLLWVLVAGGALVALGLWTHSRIEAALLRIHANMLETVEQAKVEALDLWVGELKGQVDLLAADPRVRRAARELVEIGRGKTPEAATEAWKTAPARQRLLRLAEVFATSTHSTGIAVADDRGAVVFSVVDEEIGLSVTAEGRRHLTKALGGRTVFIRPYRIGDLTGDHTTGSMYTWVVSPLRGATGEIAAVVASTQRAYGPSSLSRALAAGEHSSTLETYAFDGNGLMLSESRFTEELREVGLAPPLEDTSRAWDAGTQLNVHLRDPGGDLLRGHTPEEEASSRPLTRLAARALAALDAPDLTRRHGAVLTPYRNYRGAEVIGVWQWLPAYGFGVATEIEASEALAPLRYLDVTFALLFVLLCGFVATTLASAFSLARLRRRVQDLRELGPYQVDSVIGRGGMGTVFLAEHALLKRRTAVKVLAEDLSPESVARFEREVRLASQLTHPNTIEIYDFGRTREGVFYYAMEHVEGVTLAELVRDHGPVPPERAAQLLVQVCASLGEAHRQGLVHQDIKPQNVMVCERGGEYDVVKVLDLGLVTSVREVEPSRSARRGGTPLYMAPERVTAPDRVDARADVYSVGAVAHYLLTGRPLFETTDLRDLLRAVVCNTPAPVSEVSPVAVPPGFDSLIADCLAKDPEDRPQSIFAVRERLESLASAGEWTQAAAAEWWQRCLATPRAV